MKKLILSAGLFLSISIVDAAHAQSYYVPLGAVAGGIKLIRLIAKSDMNKSHFTITPTTYQGRSFPMQRTPAASLGILGGDQIAYLEKQLEQCHAALLANEVEPMCSASQLAQLEATQATIKQIQPKWSTQAYTDEIAFYQAENARRQQTTSPSAPAK